MMRCLNKCQVFSKLDEEFKVKVIKVCVYLKNEAFVVDDLDHVYYIINNRYYKFDLLCLKQVKQFTYSYSSNGDRFNYHMLALTENGRVYGWDRNTFDQINTSKELEISNPYRLRMSNAFLKTIRFWTSDLLYQFSEPILNTSYIYDIWNYLGNFIEPHESFSMIACGSGHCIAVTSDKKSIYVWGNNRYGQVGNGRVSISEEPHKILVKKDMVFKKHPPLDGAHCAVCMCGNCTSAICAVKCCQGLFFVRCFGGCCCYINCLRKKGKIIIPEDEVTAIASGAFHNLVLFKSGNLWGWGNNFSGQLGRIPSGVNLYPRPIFKNVKSMATFNSQTLVLCKDNVLYTMGDNTYGQLGNLEKRRCFEPIKIDLNFVEIATLNGLSMGKTANNEYYGWGLYRYEEIRTRYDTLSDSKKAYIIAKPKKLHGQSFNDIVMKYSSLTYYTIVKKQNKVNQDVKVNLTNQEGAHELLINEEPIYNVEYHEEISNGIQMDNDDDIDQELIDSSELIVIEYIFNKGDPEKMNHDDLMKATNNIKNDVNKLNDTRKVHIGDVNKFSLFDGCCVSPTDDLILNKQVKGKSSNKSGKI